MPALKACTRAGTSCGSCVPMLKNLLVQEGVEVSKALCEHFAHSRAELFEIVAGAGIRTFSELVARHGQRAGLRHLQAGGGVDPGVARAAGHVHDGEQAALQDTNDHFLANLQRNGTYSVVPRIPGGEITPEGLIAIGEVARDFGLYTKITGGQRIDMFGARVEQLPAIWRRLVDAGFESGHAYGKALRTVKSCVGHDVVPLRPAGLGRASPSRWSCATGGCARRTSSSPASRAVPGSARRPGRRTSG